MAILSKQGEEDLWNLFDTWTRGWNLHELKSVFTQGDLDKFHQFLFYLEDETDWFDWKDMEQIKNRLHSYVFMQDFLINNNSNLDR